MSGVKPGHSSKKLDNQCGPDYYNAELDGGIEWGQTRSFLRHVRISMLRRACWIIDPANGNAIKTVEPHADSAVGNEEWVEIDVAIDSGATETVMSPESLEGVVGITEGPAFVRGAKYEVANGVQISNLGERKFVGVTKGGVARSLTAQVCAVNKILMSVSKVAKACNRVVFDDDGSYIEGKRSGERIWMEQVGGMCSVRMWVSREGASGF